MRRLALLAFAWVGLTGRAAAAERAVSADFNGDGRLDAARLVDSGTIEIVIDQHASMIRARASTIAAGDLDCDGALDLVLDGGQRWLLNHELIGPIENGGGIAGASPFAPVWSSSATTLENATRHIVGDFDGDGRNELITADYNGRTGADVATLRMFENTADNHWQEVWSYSDGPRIFNGFAMGDSDGDGAIELIAGKIGGAYLGGPFVGPRVYIFEATGDNVLALDHVIEVDPALSAFTLLDDLALGDADGNGSLDIAVGLADNENFQTSTWGSRLRAFTYDAGTDQYQSIFTHTQSNIGIGWLTAIEIGDSDHDTQREIIFFERLIINVLRFEHNGVSFVQKSAPSGIPAGVCSDVMVADTDADGQVELLCGGSSGPNGHVYVFESSFDDAYALDFTDTAGLGNTVLYVDVDTSVSPPWIAGAAHSHQVLVLRHDAGAGAYEQFDVFDVPAATQLHEITIGRLDADCGLDLMLSHFNGAFSSGVYEQREIEPQAGDVNCDALVNVNDLLAVIGAWGPCAYPCPADLNHDGVVDVNDLLLVIGHWS